MADGQANLYVYVYVYLYICIYMYIYIYIFNIVYVFIHIIILSMPSHLFIRGWCIGSLYTCACRSLCPLWLSSGPSAQRAEAPERSSLRFALVLAYIAREALAGCRWTLTNPGSTALAAGDFGGLRGVAPEDAAKCPSRWINITHLYINICI